MITVFEVKQGFWPMDSKRVNRLPQKHCVYNFHTAAVALMLCLTLYMTRGASL